MAVAFTTRFIVGFVLSNLYSTSTWVICSRNVHFADTVKSACVNQPTQSEYLQLKLNKQTVLYRLKTGSHTTAGTSTHPPEILRSMVIG